MSDLSAYPASPRTTWHLTNVRRGHGGTPDPHYRTRRTLPEFITDTRRAALAKIRRYRYAGARPLPRESKFRLLRRRCCKIRCKIRLNDHRDRDTPAGNWLDPCANGDRLTAASERGLHGDLRRLQIARLPDHDAVRVLPQKRA